MIEKNNNISKEKSTDSEHFWEDILQLKKDRLIAIVAMDELDSFTVIYAFDKDNDVFMLRLKLEKNEPIVPSIHMLFPSAIYYECEIHDFFDIEFEGNHRLHDNLFLPDDFNDKKPLLK